MYTKTLSSRAEAQRRPEPAKTKPHAAPPACGPPQPGGFTREELRKIVIELIG